MVPLACGLYDLFLLLLFLSLFRTLIAHFAIPPVGPELCCSIIARYAIRPKAKAKAKAKALEQRLVVLKRVNVGGALLGCEWHHAGKPRLPGH